MAGHNDRNKEEADEGDRDRDDPSFKAVLLPVPVRENDGFPCLRITTSERNIVNDVINDSRAASDIDDLNLFIITSDPTSQKTQ